MENVSEYQVKERAAYPNLFLQVQLPVRQTLNLKKEQANREKIETIQGTKIVMIPYLGEKERKP